MYPFILIFVAVIAVTAMFWLVVPTFAKMFNDMGAELPGMTQFVVDLSNFLVAIRHLLLIGVVVAVVAFRNICQYRRRAPPVHRHWDRPAHGRRTDRPARPCTTSPRTSPCC